MEVAREPVERNALTPIGPAAVLSVRELEAGYVARDGRVIRAVRGVSFDLLEAEKLAIVGESGCGKSTLALALLGLLEFPGQVFGGEIWLNGRDLTRMSEKAMQNVLGAQISLIFQDAASALDPVMTIGDQIVEAITRHQHGIGKRKARAAAVALLKEVEVSHAERRIEDYPHQYSGGMRQRVMIAIALANDPRVVIADEPTTALDVTTQAQVLALLDRLVTERQVAVVLITHNLGIVAEFCDAVRVMYAGRFVESGSVFEIFGRPDHPYTSALLQCIPRPDRSDRRPLLAIPGFPPPLDQTWAGCSFEPRCPLGNGRLMCQDVAPVLQAAAGERPSHLSECHFAGLEARTAVLAQREEGL
jgi:oligopeptide/dipeptide ABC transporter ATP-binding protein